MHPDDPASLRGVVTSASLCDAMARRHSHRCHTVGLLPARPGEVTAGPAATIRMGPRRDDLPGHDLVDSARHALAEVPAGGVVIIAAADAVGEAVAGGKKLAALGTLGAAGVIAWGAIRDRAEAAGLGMGVWALGETPRASGDLLQVLEVGGLVTAGGITVASGDWVYVDEAGMVVVPWDDREAVVAAAAEIERDDAEAVRRIRGG